MKFAIKYLMLAFVLMSGLCQAGIVLRFQPQVSTEAKRLGDVLRIEPDTHHWARLALDSKPTPSEYLTKERMLAWMTQRVGAVNVTWLGKTSIQVNTENTTSGDALVKKAQIALATQLKNQYSRIEMKPLSQPKGSDVPLDSFKVNITLSYPVAKRVCVWLTHDRQSIPVWFDVQAYSRVLIAQRHTVYDKALTKDAFVLQERNIAGLKGKPAQARPDKLWLNTSLQAGDILLTQHIKEPPLVVPGQTVKVRLHQNRINLVMEAVALTGGYRGQSINVKNPVNQQTFAVKITGLRQAEVTS